MIKKNSKNKILNNRLVPKYTRGASWLTLQVSFILALSVIVKDVEAQEEVYVTPDVNIFEYQEQVFELPGSGDYISREQVSKYNFKNINDILRNTPGVYSREENGFGIFPNISLRGVNTLRSAAIDLLEDGINIAPAPYSAPDAYYSPLAGKMHAIEVLKGSSQFRYGPHNTGGVINYVTTPIELGEKYFGEVSYGSFNDKTTHAYGNYGLSGSYGSVAILGEMYFRENDGFHDFNGSVDSNGFYKQEHYGSDDAGGLLNMAPMVKLLWQLPTTRNVTIELKGAHNSLDYNAGYTGLTEADFNADPYQRYVGSQLDNMNSNSYNYYAKLRADISNNVKNNLTFYYNQFARDWFKLNKVGATGDVDSLQSVVSKAYTESDDLNVLKGLTAGQVQYKNNDRQYYAYGIMNETDLNFSTDVFGNNIDHDLKIGVKYHYDKITREEQLHTFNQAVGGALSVAQATGGADDDSGTTNSSDRTEKSKGYALYFEESAKYGKFTASFGSRFEYVKQHYRNTTAAAGSTSNIEETIYTFSPGGGLVYKHDENMMFFGGVYKGVNLPGPGSSRDDGSPLNPERSLAKELGVRYTAPSIAASLTGFHTNFSDVIVIDNSNTGGNPDNAGKVISKGLEFSGAYEPENILPKGDISFYANYTFTNANLDGASTTTDSESIFAGGRDGSNVPYIPEHVLSFGSDYDLDKFNFGINMTYHSETFGTAEETETEESIGSANARAGRIDSAFLLNFYGGYTVNDNYKISAGVNNATDLEYISSRHPAGARSGAPLSAYIKAVAKF